MSSRSNGVTNDVLSAPQDVPCQLSQPEDDAEHYAAAIEAEPAAPSDEVEAAHVGGPFVTEAFYRPALRRS